MTSIYFSGAEDQIFQTSHQFFIYISAHISTIDRCPSALMAHNDAKREEVGDLAAGPASKPFGSIFVLQMVINGGSSCGKMRSASKSYELESNVCSSKWH